ncbi:TIGR02680 family protein [Rhodococcus sp. HNM0569]|uniref:TIGR02680 family protein n=1 Tax=Rhodococcus sp. HNM0569 TaxID=2716340 RepID=UPI00146C93A9|nr:TIGR02680 family protein [Rhodococcus sp. HNM0569]NLU84921.1 TIGR02680 family protein [Rhodococcus sp. HNM0569]
MTNARFRPTRAGIVNLWDYRDQEFSFADGRLVLRGPNGSGKTKALEVLFPFVFDGRIEPRRLNPFAGEERTMKSNLLYRGQETAYSYVWMEFCRGDNDDPEAVTVGIGMRASRGTDKVSRWYFVVDGRVGIDFSLLGDDDRPFTRKQLVDEVGTDSVVDRPIDYRAAVDARLFGLGLQRYDQLINLVLTLRRPQLAKNLDPKGLSRALTDGLRPLDDALVLEAARSFSDMEEVGRALDALTAADTAAASFVDVYRKYLRQHARGAVDQVAERLTAVESAVAAVRAAAAETAAATAAHDSARAQAEAADAALDAARANHEALAQSGAYEDKQQIDALARVVDDLRRGAEGLARREDDARAAAERRGSELDEATAAAESATAAAERAHAALRDSARDAGLEWESAGDDRHPARGSGAEAVATRARALAEQRSEDVRVVAAALDAQAKAHAERVRAGEFAERAVAARTDAEAALAAAEADVEAARSRVLRALRDWWSGRVGLYASVDVGVEMFDVLCEGARRLGQSEAPTLTSIVHEHTASTADAIRRREHDARADSRLAQERLDTLTAERARVAGEHDDAPPTTVPHSPERDVLPGAPLWRLVRFRDDIDPTDAGGVEAALESAGLLDAWVLPEGHDIPSEVADRFLAPGRRAEGPSLADVLEPEGTANRDDTAGVDVPRVQAVLESVALSLEADGVATAVDGRFRHGLLSGRHDKTDAEYIGATARERRRRARLAQLDADIDDASAVRDRADHTAAEAAELLSALASAAKELPRAAPVSTALASVAEAAGALRSRTESADAAAQDHDRSVVDANAQDEHVRRVASGRGIAPDPTALDAVRAALTHFTHSADTWVTARRETANAVERAERAGMLAAEAERDAEAAASDTADAERNHATRAAHLDTLRENLGADAEQIEADLARARQRIDECQAVERAARDATGSAAKRVGSAEQARDSAATTLLTAFVEAHKAAQLLRPYARRDVLALLDATPVADWPEREEAWLTPEQLAYRVETDLSDENSRATDSPVDTHPVLPDVVAALYASLTAATDGVRHSESAAKSTRTNVVTALQEFESDLSSTGQGYQLSWDTPDGVIVAEVRDEQGVSSVADFAARIARARADQELLLTDSERRILEDALLTGLAQQIHERTVDARSLIAQMASEMRERRMSSGATIGLRWTLADGLDDGGRAVAKLLDRDASSLGGDDLAAMRAYFASRIRTERAAHPERSYPEILSSALDYRTWRTFTFAIVDSNGEEERLTVARHSALSGGEQSVSLHLPLFAAAHVMLDSADPHAPRLLALDEAFAGVDENGRTELLGLSVQFDLDLFMTGYDLWVTSPEVPACAHYSLSHSAAEHAVSALLVVWTGEGLDTEYGTGSLSEALGSPGTRRIRPEARDVLEFDAEVDVV